MKRTRFTVHRCLRVMLLAILALSVRGLYAQSHTRVVEWLTTPHRTALLARYKLTFQPRAPSTGATTIFIDETHTRQTIDGFGFALTGGSAQLLMQMSPAKRRTTLKALFGTKGDAIGVSYLRLSIGSSDMNERVFTYDDMPSGETDGSLTHFSLGPDLSDVVPVMQQILKINPAIKILGTPWSAPSWMKSNDDAKGGSLKPEYYDAYARYLVLYVQAMAAHGIRIDAITPQNEPLNPKNTPSMIMTAEEEAAFLTSSLGPLFHQKAIATKIILYDHNCDRPDYPLTILADPQAAQYADGSGFHLYGGTIDAMSKVHDTHPEKNVYFTEQMVVDNAKDDAELRIAEPVSSIVIGALSNWSRNVLLWNLAADPAFGPHTGNGGCPVCEGAITISGDNVTRNLAYYTIAQISKFVRPGAMVLESSGAGKIPAHIAFRNSNGRITLLTANTTASDESLDIAFHGKSAHTTLPAGAVATYVW